MVGDRFPQRVPSSWSSGLLLWRLDSFKYRESPVNGRIVQDSVTNVSLANCLSWPENTAGGQPRFRNTIPCPKQFRKKLYVIENSRHLDPRLIRRNSNHA